MWSYGVLVAFEPSFCTSFFFFFFCDIHSHHRRKKKKLAVTFFLQVIQREERARQQEAHSVTLGQPAKMLLLRHFAVGISMDTP